MAQVIKGVVDGKGHRVAIAVARYNELVSSKLLTGAIETLERHGVSAEDITVVWVPGSFELPVTCRWLADQGHDAVLALGTVIRGATSHYEHICTQAARGVMDTSLATSIPVIFGVLTCETLDQALERTGSGDSNKGAEAAATALEMLAVKRAIAGDGTHGEQAG